MRPVPAPKAPAAATEPKDPRPSVRHTTRASSGSKPLQTGLKSLRAAVRYCRAVGKGAARRASTLAKGKARQGNPLDAAASYAAEGRCEGRPLTAVCRTPDTGARSVRTVIKMMTMSTALGRHLPAADGSPGAVPPVAPHLQPARPRVGPPSQPHHRCRGIARRAGHERGCVAVRRGTPGSAGRQASGRIRRTSSRVIDWIGLVGSGNGGRAQHTAAKPTVEGCAAGDAHILGMRACSTTMKGVPAGEGLWIHATTYCLNSGCWLASTAAMRRLPGCSADASYRHMLGPVQTQEARQVPAHRADRALTGARAQAAGAALLPGGLTAGAVQVDGQAAGALAIVGATHCDVWGARGGQAQLLAHHPAAHQGHAVALGGERMQLRQGKQSDAASGRDGQAKCSQA